MRHAKKRLQLNRFTSWYEATIKSLSRNLLIQQSIKTTLHKAKAAQPMVEKLITLARKNTLAAKRQAYQILGDHKLVSVLFNEIGPRFANRASGFTRIINLARRRGDNAQVVLFELTEIKKKEIKKPKKIKEEKPVEAPAEEAPKEKPVGEKKPPIVKKPAKKFFGGIRSIFKKERDSL